VGCGLSDTVQCSPLFGLLIKKIKTSILFIWLDHAGFSVVDHKMFVEEHKLDQNNRNKIVSVVFLKVSSIFFAVI